MAAISKATHYKLISDIKVFLSSLPASTDSKHDLQANLLLMEQLYEIYSVDLSQLRMLISKYATLERVVKLELRREQLKKIKQKLPVS